MAPNTSGIGKQGAMYLFAGISSALIELGLFELLFEWAHLDVAWANAIAVAVATVYNFAINKGLTFAGSPNLLRSVFRYLLLLIVNYCITTVAIMGMVSLGVPSAIAKLVMQGCVACWNFFLYRHFVFAGSASK